MATSLRLEAAPYPAAGPLLHAIRHEVFVRGQGIDPGLERDAEDPLALHVLARTADGTPVGTGRLARDGRIGRMAVLPGWRGRGVGAAMLAWLCARAGERGLRRLHLHAQLPAMALYARQGFLPEGPRHLEAGLPHQTMVHLPGQPMPVDGAESAAAALCALLAPARGRAWLALPPRWTSLLADPLVAPQLAARATGPVPVTLALAGPPPADLPSGPGLRVIALPAGAAGGAPLAANAAGGWLGPDGDGRLAAGLPCPAAHTLRTRVVETFRIPAESLATPACTIAGHWPNG